MLTYTQLGKAGRLGNQLWEIASTLGLAQTHGEDFCFPTWDYEPYFQVDQSKFRGGGGEESFSERLVPHLDERCRVYLQDYSLWKDSESLVRQWFQPTEVAQVIVSDHMERNGVSDVPYEQRLAVHVRRGDLLTIESGYHPLTKPDYYKQAFDTFNVDVTPILFSDDIEWCKQTFPTLFGCECVFVEGGVQRPPGPEYRRYPAMDWVDMFTMAECSHHIIPNSTYSWWGAFLSRNPAPRFTSNWFGAKLHYIDFRRMMPEGWIEIPC